MGSRAARGALTAMGLRRFGIVLGLLAGLAGPASAAPAACRDDLVLIRHDRGEARFAVEIADDAAERAQGLMGRERMPAGAGMLFIYDRPEPVAFWMKNTPLPLDLLFIDETGRVVHLHENAVPFDETPLPSGTPVLMVLEINGGLARRIGIAPGAVIAHPRLDRAIAAFPCD
ncbi:DUF192 domain-containing protein [Pontitalea aquivivens]|uniref:DUF192 domain-containing protein n=1 Tax=Pontitalea aquivivens TaxID=3388663 RepID=UPI003970B1D6